MQTLVIVVFILGYLGIAFEHPVKINKTAPAILTGVLCWTIFMLSGPTQAIINSEAYTSFVELLRKEYSPERLLAMSGDEQFREFVNFELAEHLSEIAQILFFLMGAMTIVELVDAHHGFRFVTARIKTRNLKVLLWIICCVTFFLSAILDNLTTSIVMVSLVRKLVPHKDLRLIFAGMIVISANAGGAWTPIGDVTTTMLWIGGQISTVNIIKTLFVPSLICLLVPLTYLSFKMKGVLGEIHQVKQSDEVIKGGRRMLGIGVAALISVPIFKSVTSLPPYLGMLFGLGALWAISELLHSDLEESVKKRYTAAGALSRIDVSSVLFFLGILLAVGALESMQILHAFAELLDKTFGDHRIIITLIGALSAVVDNVPLVAASMGMYSMEEFPKDHMIWEYLAYCAGTGGSMLIIGSAAGVAVMGIEKVDFIWYLKKMALLAMMGYLSGAAFYVIMHSLMPL